MSIDSPYIRCNGFRGKELNLFNLKRFFSLLKWPSKSQWRQFFRTLNKREKTAFFVLLGLFLSSFLALSLIFYFKNTEKIPAKGGVYTEGVIGSPRFINPVYAAASDVDRDLTELIYSGLMKYDENGKVIPDLAKEYKILENGKVYEFSLKENLLWQDGKPLTADDVIFTIKTIQNPSIKSPVRSNWLGVKIEKISEKAVRFELENPSAVFLENCTLKVLPQHVWQDVTPQNFPLSIYNLNPIGSGPYKLKNLIQDKQGNVKSLELVANPNYSENRPHIPKINFLFFDTEDDLIKAFNSQQIKGFSLLSSATRAIAEGEQDLKNIKDFSEYHLFLPRYFAVFFNPEKSKILAEKKVREALNYGTDKKEIIDKVLSGKGEAVDSPILPKIYGFAEPTKIYEFNPETSEKLLEEAGFAKTDNGLRSKNIENKSNFSRLASGSSTKSGQFKSDLGLGSQGSEVKELQKCLAKDPEVYPGGEVTSYFGKKTKEAVIKFQEKYKEEILEPYGLKKGTGEIKESSRAKLNKLCYPASEETASLSFSLSTVDQPALKEVAEILKNQWERLGINLEIKTSALSNLGEEIIKPRNYDMLLFGEVLGAVPDPFPFWHSSQKKDPGLNLAVYENKKSDKLLEEARQTMDNEERKNALEKFQEILIEDAPTILLYNPDYIYLVAKEFKGINTKIIVDPSKRFADAENWYIKTKRVWK